MTKSGPGRRAHSLGHLGDERRAAGDLLPAVAVGAQVGPRPQELVEQEAVRRVELHAVGADLRGVERALDERALEAGQLSLRGGAAKRLTRGARCQTGSARRNPGCFPRPRRS